MRFDHQRLDVYQQALQFTAFTRALITDQADAVVGLADQLRRAARSIPLNIAEGGGEFSPREKARFYRIAKRSATECVAILDVIATEMPDRGPSVEPGLEMLDRVVGMLTKMILRMEERETGE